MDQLLYTIDETAEILGLSRATIYRLVKSGHLVAVKVGRLRRVTRQALERFTMDLERKARRELVKGF